MKVFLEGSLPKARTSNNVKESLDDRLLAAAVEVFLEKGFTSATVDEIAARAKASKLTFYNRYGNKEALFGAVVRRQNGLLVELLSKVFPEGIAFEDLLDAVAHRLFEAFLQSDAVKLVRVLHAEAARFPQLADVFDEAGPATAVKIIAVEMKRQMDLGRLRHANPLLAAEHFLHLSIGEVTRRILLGLRPPLNKEEVDRRIAAGIEVFLRAYAP